MIKSFANKHLNTLWTTGSASKINASFHRRILDRLDAMNAAQSPKDLNLPGFNFHPLKGFKPARYSIHVNGPWCLTFEFDGNDVANVKFEQYH